MADPTKAEIMLDQVTKINALIRRFQLCKDHPAWANHGIFQQWGSRRLPHPPRNNVDPVQWVGVNRYSLFRVSEMSG